MLPIGEVGEMGARSYAVLIDYDDISEATVKAIDSDGWLHNGDLGMMDAQGFVRETDRVKDMIIRGGENRLPAKIEAVIVTNPQVAQVAVVGLQDKEWGENIAAFSLSDQPPKVTDLRAHCWAHLSG